MSDYLTFEECIKEVGNVLLVQDALDTFRLLLIKYANNHLTFYEKVGRSERRIDINKENFKYFKIKKPR